MPSVTWQRQTESPCYLSSILTQHSHPPKGYPLCSASKQNKAWCCECLVPSDESKNTAAAGEEKKELWREGGKQWRREKRETRWQRGRGKDEKGKSEDQKETWRTEKPEMWYFLEWQGKGEWWGGGHSVARVSYHPHWADFFRQSILWPLLVLTVTWLTHQESPWLPWLLGSCPSLVAEKTHILTPAQGERWRVSLGKYGLGTMGNQKEQMASGWDREKT